MAIFWNIFVKTIAIFFSVLFIVTLSIILLSFIQDSNEKFKFLSGDENSNNTIALIELSGVIIENNGFSNLTNPFIISPRKIKKILESLEDLSPKVIIFSINSPGGTVSASKNFYEIIKNFKKKSNTEVVFHTNELLASGAYWAASSGDKIYASYGSIIGSIGVKGPDWFFYDQPKSISTGIFGNTIETKKTIKVFSNKAGKSKDLLNPFRKPTAYELEHLQNIVNEIYEDFVRIVSKERKIEINSLIDDIGALIYSSNNAAKLHLIDEVFNLEDLIKEIVIKKKFENYKVVKIYNKNNTIIRQILEGNFNISALNMEKECLSMRSSIVAILSYQSTGC